MKFVPDGISPEALSQMLFPGSKPKTRSLFDQSPPGSQNVDVSIAMLIQFHACCPLINIGRVITGFASADRAPGSCDHRAFVYLVFPIV